jgi:phosphate butyryltransferase
MLRNFQEMLTRAKNHGRVTVSVAVAQDRDVLQAVKDACEAGLIKAILVGDAVIIKGMLSEIGLAADTAIIHEPDIKKAALTAASLVKNGEAQILMKGLVNSADFIRAVLNEETGLRTGRLLSHLSAYEIPGGEKMVFHTDGGVNIAPALAEKAEILMNALLALAGLGIERPNVAVLAANEVVSTKMPATMDAKALADMGARGEFPPSVIEGPIAMDVAISRTAAEHKNIQSSVAGRVDLFVMPNIEAGNLVSKALILYAGFKSAGVIVGATHPVVMGSRSDSAEAKLNSIAMACCMAKAGQ